MRLSKRVRRTLAFSLAPLHRRQAEQALPFLREAAASLSEIEEEWRPAYDAYVSDVSGPTWAVSLETAALLTLLCRRLGPKRVLDTGSGFSSVVLNTYGAGDVIAYSIDDSPEWAEQTRAVLRERGLPTERTMLWDDFAADDHGPFDLIFHDLGNMETRAETLPRILELGRGGFVVLDDMHKKTYAERAYARLRDAGYRHANLRPYTLDALGRFAVLAWTDLN